MGQFEQDFADDVSARVTAANVAGAALVAGAAPALGGVVAAFSTIRFMFVSGFFLFCAIWTGIGGAFLVAQSPPVLRVVLQFGTPTVVLLMGGLCFLMLWGTDRGVAIGARVLAFCILAALTLFLPAPTLRPLVGTGAQIVITYLVVWLLLSWVLGGLGRFGGMLFRIPLTLLTCVYSLILLAVPVWIAISLVTEVQPGSQSVHGTPTMKRIESLQLSLACSAIEKFAEEIASSGHFAKRCER